MLRLGILVDLDTAHEAHGFTMSYFHLTMGELGVWLAHGPLVDKPFTHAFTLQCFSHVQVPQYDVFGLVR